MTATDDYEKLEHQCRVLKAALRNVDGYIDFNKAAIESGFPSGDRFRQHLLRCFDDGESIRTRTSIIGAGPDAPMPFAAVKTAPLTLQKAGSQKVEVSSNRGNTTSRDFRTRHAAPDRSDNRMSAAEIEEYVSDSEIGERSCRCC